MRLKQTLSGLTDTRKHARGPARFFLTLHLLTGSCDLVFVFPIFASRRRRSPDSDHGRRQKHLPSLDPAAAAQAAAKALSEAKEKVERDVADKVALEVRARVLAEAAREVAVYVATAEFRKMVEEMKRAERQRVLGEVQASVAADKIARDATDAAAASAQAAAVAAAAAAAAEEQRAAELHAAEVKAVFDAARLVAVEARQRDDDERERQRLVRPLGARAGGGGREGGGCCGDSVFWCVQAALSWRRRCLVFVFVAVSAAS
jgi:pyruvate/2-oxoglutarate dehydrogenase complex dihydrolipoamide acyltransferase (E2) component